MTGAVASTVHEKLVEEPVLPTVSVARTSKLCGTVGETRQLLRARAGGRSRAVEAALEERDARRARRSTVGSVPWNVKSAVDEFVSAAGVESKAAVGDGLVDRVHLARDVAVAGAGAAERVAGGVDDRVVVDQVEAERAVTASRLDAVTV